MYYSLTFLAATVAHLTEFYTEKKGVTLKPTKEFLKRLE
jgi:hypothetical protein